MSTLYVVLGVPRNATSEEIRRAYKQVALQNHPDKTLSLHAAERLHREDIFKNARNAYEILSDSDKRRKYDLTLPRPPKPATVPTPKRSRTETRFPVNTTAAKNPEPRKPPFGRQPKPAGHTDKTKHPFSFFDNEEEHRKWKEAAYVPDPDEKTRANANASNTGGGEQNSAGDKRKDWNWGSSFAPEEAQRDDNANIRPSQSAGSSTFPQGEKQWNFFRQGPHGGHFHYMANSQRGKPRKTHNQHSTSDSTIYHAFEPMEANKTNPKQGNEGGYSSSTDHTQFGGSFFSKAAPHDTSFAEHRKEYMRSKAEDATTSLKREMDDYAERLRKTKYVSLTHQIEQ